MGQITVDQSHQVVATLVTNTTWEDIDFEGAGLQNLVIRNPKEAGRQFTAFLKNGGRIIVGEPGIIHIDRTAPFDPVKFLGQRWTIGEEDERSLELTQLDLSKVLLKHMLKKGESSIRGEEELRRLKSADYVRLDAKIFQTFWENQQLIPELWKERTDGNITFVFFDGTVLRGPSGDRCVLCLYWGVGRWNGDYCWLGHDWHVYHPSAVLASI